MRAGRKCWTSTCPPALLARVHELIDAGRLSAREIHASADLTRYVRLSTFQHYATGRRRDRAQRQEHDRLETGPTESGPAGDETEAAPDGVLARALAAMQRVLDAEEVPAYALPAFVKSMQGLAELKIREEELALDQAADKRAQEKHEAWREELRREQDAALDAVSKTSQLSPEQVAEIRAKVLGL